MRVFLKNPPILILDEGTSALDNISERNVQKAINAARADRTVILVAHRLSTLIDAGRIFVFDEGRIAETGTFAELVQLGGVFTELVRHAENGCFTLTNNGHANNISAHSMRSSNLLTNSHAEANPHAKAISHAETMAENGCFTLTNNGHANNISAHPKGSSNLLTISHAEAIPHAEKMIA